MHKHTKHEAHPNKLHPAVHRAVLITAIALPVPFVVALVILGSPVSWIVLAISLFAVVAYSAPGLRFKEIPVLDSITSSTHFTSPAVYGLVLAGGLWDASAIIALSALFLWGAASQAFGAVQDVIPDREGGIRSIATIFGAAPTVRLAIVLWTLAGLLMLLLPWPAPLIAPLALVYIALAWPFRSVRDEDSEHANLGWRRFLAANYVVGFLITMVLIAMAMGWR